LKTWICTTMTNFYGPLLGAARLYAYIKNQGHDVSFKDLNQDVFFTLLSPKYLGQALERIQNSIDYVSRNRLLREDLGAILLHSSDSTIKQLAVKGILLGKSWYRYIEKTKVLKGLLYGFAGSRIQADNVLYALLSEKDYILSEIEKSRQILKHGFFSLEPQVFVEHFSTLLCGKAIMDAAYFPTQLDFGLGFYGTSYSPRVGDILRATQDERYNFLIPYYQDEVLPSFQEEAPSAVGISITCMFELVPAFTLAHLIKKVSPETHITLGGVLVTELSERISRNAPLWNHFDSLVLGPGEAAFSALLEQVEKKSNLSGVPNIIYKSNGNITKSDIIDEFDINEACTPEFVSLHPMSGLPLETASSCYWGKCIFCYYPRQGTAGLEATNARKRVRRMELVLEDIRTLRDKYNPIAIALTDSSVHPRRLENIADENLRSEKKVKYFALFRLEKEFKSKAFCRKLAEGGFLGGYVGLESGSQRVNDIINKGIDLNDTVEIIKNFYQTGILMHIYSIVGTPGETEEDAVKTCNFFKRWHRQLKLGWQIYPLYVLEQSPIAYRAEEFDVEAIPLPDDYLVESMLYRVGKGLSQEQSMELSISYAEELKRYMHPLSRIMDIESLKIFLMIQMAKGIPPDKVK
jgi:anaerobic magnesium-protoporphyrin IX monomethyl ester cyclase